MSIDTENISNFIDDEDRSLKSKLGQLADAGKARFQRSESDFVQAQLQKSKTAAIEILKEASEEARIPLKR